MQVFLRLSFDFILVLQFILNKCSLGKMGAEESTHLSSQSQFQHTPKSNNHSQAAFSNSFQTSSTCKRKLKIFQKKDNSQPVTLSFSAEPKSSHSYSGMEQRSVMNYQITTSFQKQFSTYVPDFKQRENSLMLQRNKLRKDIKQDLQNYLLSDSPINKCAINPQKKILDKIKNQQNLNLQAVPKKTNLGSPNNCHNIKQTAYNENSHLNSPNLLIAKGIVTRHSSGSSKEVSKITNSQTIAFIQQNNEILKISGAMVSCISQPEHNMLRIQGPLRSSISQNIKERLQSDVYSGDEDGMQRIKGKLISAVESQDGSVQVMLKINDRLVSAVQAEDELNRKNNKLVKID